MTAISDAELEAYLDEGLEGAKAADLERSIRADEALQRRIAIILRRRDGGYHSLGEIWRRHHVGQPTREELGSYLLGVLPDNSADYIRFRLDVLQCPFTIANIRDLERQQATVPPAAQSRRKKYFETSVGYLRDRQEED